MNYNQRGYDSYSGPRRNSVSSDGQGAKRKKWNNRKRGRGSLPGPSANTDNPVFKQPSSPSPNKFNRSRRENYYSGGLGGYQDEPYYSSTHPHFDMRDLPPFVEPEHNATSPWFWTPYFQDCSDWQDKHKLAYYKSRCLALEFENQMLFDQIKSLMDENCVFAVERNVAPVNHSDLPGFRPPRQEQDERSPKASNNQSVLKTQGKKKQRTTSTSSDDKLVFDVPDSMISVIEESIRHKLTLRQERKNEAANQKKNEDDLKNKKAKLEEEGPKVPMGQIRKEELDQLYGENSTTIHKLETALQFNFNRNFDTHKPEVFMTVPLNPATVEG